ncbi:MAG TPA: non-ribosomal peptide synthetase [Casimicrobiaceae bacterium]|nr:non-ribosomal peptide synthetase [Casimicrobiaceae bacterium]
MNAPHDTLAFLIAQHARERPEATALLAPGREPLSYAGLVEAMDDVGATLARAGFGRGSRIATALDNGPETAVAMLGVMSYATCVPLNPDGAEQRLPALCRRLRLDALIVAENARAGVRRAANDVGLPTIDMAPSTPGSSTLRVAAPKAPRRAEAAEADDIALLLATSGTTGEPKIIPLTQRSHLATALPRVQLLALTPRDRAVGVAPMFTPGSLRGTLFPSLAAGASVVYPPRFDAAAMLEWLESFAATFYVAGPAVHRAMLAAMDRYGVPRHALRFVVSNATNLPPDLQMRLESTLGVPVIQTYATGEAGTIAQNRLPPAQRRPGSVGSVVDGEIRILDDDETFAPLGMPGEIVVRGPQVFAGYENDPEANRRAFFDGWFRTGDRGKVDGDGFLYLTGRVKETINRGGFKVPPADVDAALMQHPRVAEVATFGVPHPTLGEDVVTAVVARNDADRAGGGDTFDAPPTAEGLRDFALATLPAFMVPSRILLVPDIPKSTFGKVRRHELAEAFSTLLRPAYQPPRDGTETAVARIFAEALGIARVGAFDNFFALGGDSLRGAQAAARAAVVFGRALDPVMLFRNPTVAQFAAEIGRLAVPATAPPIVALSRRVSSATDNKAPRTRGSE